MENKKNMEKGYWVQTNIFVRATNEEDARSKIKKRLMDKEFCFLIYGAEKNEFE